MSQFTLYAHKGSGPNPRKPAILLTKLGLSFDVIDMDFGDDPQRGVKSDKYLKVNPNGRVPTLIDHSNNDFLVWESAAILTYIAEKYDVEGRYYGKTVEERAIVAQWQNLLSTGLAAAQGNLNYAYHAWEAKYGTKAPKDVFTRFESECHRLYTLLDGQLARQKERGSQFVALDRLSLADIHFFVWVDIAGYAKLDVSSYSNVQEWLQLFKADKDVQSADATLPK